MIILHIHLQPQFKYELFHITSYHFTPQGRYELNKEVYGIRTPCRTASRTASGLPYISLQILTFSNGCILVKTSLINTKLRNLVNLGKLFLTM